MRVKKETLVTPNGNEGFFLGGGGQIKNLSKTAGIHKKPDSYASRPYTAHHTLTSSCTPSAGGRGSVAKVPRSTRRCRAVKHIMLKHGRIMQRLNC